MWILLFIQKVNFPKQKLRVQILARRRCAVSEVASPLLAVVCNKIC